MAKPKAKSQAEKDAEFERMVAGAATHNDLEDAGGAAEPAAPAEPAPTPPAVPTSEEPTTEVEQKGENISVAPAPEPTPTAGMATEAAAPAAPDPAPALTPPPMPEPAAAPGPAAESAPVPNGGNVSESEPSAETVAEPTSAVNSAVDGESMNFDLASLFKRSTEKKTFSMRIPDRHYQYLLVLGTIVGAGASPPDIIYNLVEQFIEKHDVQVQKAIQKQMRLRTKKP